MGWCEDHKKYNVLGSFEEVSFGRHFDFSENTEKHWVSPKDYPHVIHMADGGVRYAHVKKTVVYVIVDEDPYGLPVVEKWFIKNRRLKGE